MKTSTSTMTAVVQDGYGEADRLYVDHIVKPEPKPGEVRVRVRAVSLNPADKFIMRGDPRLLRLAFGLGRPRNRVRGKDLAGVVDAVGEGVNEFAIGDEVFGELDSALAEFACGRADHLAPMPSSLTFEQAASLPMTGLAALAGLRSAKVGDGTRLLINGASGGIGTLAIALAKARGAHVTAVCSTRNVDLVRSLGADEVIDYTSKSLLATDHRFDVILDNVGNHRIRDLLPLLSGRGVLQPNTGEPGPDGTALARLIKSVWYNVTTRHRVDMFQSSPSRADLDELARLAADGTVTVVIDTMFEFTHAADAMRRLATGHARGKVVVTIN
jgi:NADPH:quinone reductase-like Zn-dependent oxidoreductase